MRRLENVTVVCIDTINIGAAVVAIRKTLSQVKPDRCLFITSVDIDLDGVDCVQIPQIKTVDEYSRFCIKELHKYIHTDFCLLIQHDGYVLNGDCFDDVLYGFDYCGAPWLEKDGLNVGNGGFSWRSKKLLDIVATDEKIENFRPEDVAICRVYRRYLEDVYGLKWATENVAERFSFELREPNQRTFGFHGFFHEPYKDVVVVKRTGAMGDVVRVEPVLRYFYEKGYRVVLDTLPAFKHLFYQHYFKVEFFDEIDFTRLPYVFYNLDMSYESTPLKNHVESYFDFCGIKDVKPSKPKLNLYQNPKSEIKLFKKYCVLHLDNREQPHRNVTNIDWDFFASVLASDGYTVIQVGNGNNLIESSHIHYMKTPSTQFLMWVVGGADLFVGIDSGISNIAVAFDVPSIIFSGSVNLDFIHVDMSNIEWIHNHPNVCDTPFCWHNVIGTTGKDCYVDKDNPPCSVFYNMQIIESYKKISK